MPLITPTPNLIEIEVSDRIVNDTKIKQKARFQSLMHVQGPEQDPKVVVVVIVTMYAADGNDYGPKLTARGMSEYRVELVADNNSVVDAADGTVLATRTNESAGAWKDIIDSFEQATMLQGDFFMVVRDHETINITDLITQHVEQADALGRFLW